MLTSAMVFATMAIGLVAVGVRGHRIRSRGLIFWDDGERALQALSMAQHLGGQNGRRRSRPTVAPKYPYDANPLSMLLNVVGGRLARSFVTGPLLINVVFGLVGVAGVQALGTVLFDERAGLLAACIIAVSGYHIVYSRSFHAEVTCGAFAVWALFFYSRSLQDGGLTNLAFAGVLVAGAFLCNSRQLFAPLIFIGYEALLPLTGGSFHPDRVVVLSLAMGAPLVFVEIAYQGLRLTGYRGPTYVRQIAGMVKSGRAQLDPRLPSLRILVRAFAELEGPTAVLMAAAVVWLAVRWSTASWLLAPQIIVPLAFWSARPTRIEAARPMHVYAMPRFASLTIYPLSVATGAFLGGWPNGLLYPVLVLVVAGGLYRSRHFWRMKSGYAAVAKFLLEHGGERHLSLCPPNTGFYVGSYPMVVERTVAMLDGKRTLGDEAGPSGCRYLVYVPAIHRNTFGAKRRMNEEVDRLVASAEPVLTVPLGMPPLRALYWDEHNNPQATVLVHNVVSVYDLAPISFARPPALAAPHRDPETGKLRGS